MVHLSKQEADKIMLIMDCNRTLTVFFTDGTELPVYSVGQRRGIWYVDPIMHMPRPKQINRETHIIFGDNIN